MTSESDSGERVAVYVCYFGLCQPLVQTQVISSFLSRDNQRGATRGADPWR
jgi:hypothetical protein